MAVKTNESPDIIVSGTNSADSIVNYGCNVTINSGKGNDTIENIEGERGYYYDEVNKWINGGYYVSINAGSGNNLIFNSYGEYCTINAGAGNDSIVNYFGRHATINTGAGNDSVINDNFSDYSTINTGAGNDSVYNYVGWHTTINTGIGNDLINLSSKTFGDVYDSSENIIIYNSGDGNDKIIGFDRDDTLSIGGGSYSTKKSGDDIIVTVGKGKISLIGAASLSKVNIKGTKATSTTLTVSDKTKSPVTVGSAIKTINASKRTTAVQITANDLANTIKGGKGNDTFYGGKGNDTILGSYGDDKLYGQAGNDTLTGGPGNDNLWGGDGNDVFIYGNGDGKDIINDYASGDKISVRGSISKAAASGSDVVFTIGKGSITVKNAKGKSLNMADNSGKNYSTIVGGSTTSTLLTVNDKTKSPVTVGSAIKTIKASDRTLAIKITGNDNNNTILGGKGNDTFYGGKGNDTILGSYGDDKLYGQAGNDTLTGGKGNDSLWGDAGKDTFIYANGDGKDVIYGFDNTDMLKITGTFTGTYNSSKKEVYFKVGSTSNAITLKNFSTTTFNINSTNYKISGTKLVKK